LTLTPFEEPYAGPQTPETAGATSDEPAPVSVVAELFDRAADAAATAMTPKRAAAATTTVMRSALPFLGI
jgi:hypothetical protein